MLDLLYTDIRNEYVLVNEKIILDIYQIIGRNKKSCYFLEYKACDCETPSLCRLMCIRQL